jgi:hypothetical protein
MSSGGAYATPCRTPSAPAGRVRHATPSCTAARRGHAATLRSRRASAPRLRAGIRDTREELYVMCARAATATWALCGVQSDTIHTYGVPRGFAACSQGSRPSFSYPRIARHVRRAALTTASHGHAGVMRRVGARAPHMCPTRIRARATRVRSAREGVGPAAGQRESATHAVALVRGISTTWRVSLRRWRVRESYVGGCATIPV